MLSREDHKCVTGCVSVTSTLLAAMSSSYNLFHKTYFIFLSCQPEQPECQLACMISTSCKSAETLPSQTVTCCSCFFPSSFCASGKICSFGLVEISF